MTATARAATARTLLIHLRLHFQLLLAPIFLWGYVLAGGGVTLEGLAIFVAFHVFLYGGVTALNSYYDRDEGPVGGLAQPPPVVPVLLPFSLGWQALGFAILLPLNRPAALVYAAIFCLSVAYSHPAVRWKSHTWAALLTVAFGQGVLGFAAGWLAVEPSWLGLNVPLAWLGAVAAALLVTGFFPLSQVYQVDEDRTRGDLTLAVRFGPRVALAAGGLLSVLGLLGLIIAAAWRFGPADALLLLAGYVLFAVWLAGRAGALASGRLPVLAQYRLVMRAAFLNAAGLWLYLLVRLAVGWTGR